MNLQYHESYHEFKTAHINYIIQCQTLIHYFVIHTHMQDWASVLQVELETSTSLVTTASM